MESVIRLFRTQLFSAFFNWLEVNKDKIGKWYSRLYNEAKGADVNTAIEIMAVSMWMFNMIACCGVGAGVGPKGFNLHYLENDLDEDSTKRLLTNIVACMNLQYLPPDIAREEIPVISSKRFSLKLYTQEEEHAPLSNDGTETALPET